ncbi:oligosaccharide flippase family protein [uncultured Cocleimonas sp.]|uniref:oligosaccharide flippase family protein n=1 Tax=uncultured Cocleimonas sp. TaxID=1051587 RepID=UPI002604382F|nr:oligosaccharide flippase family protein [uncultured Cocleimonas sp.]
MANLKERITHIPTEVIGVLIHITYVVLTFLAWAILARTLDPEVFGRYAYLISWVALTVSFITAGLPIFLVREISTYKQNNEQPLIRGIIYSSFLFVVFFFLLVVIGVFIINSFDEFDPGIIFPLLTAVFFLPFMAIYQAATKGLGHVILGQISTKLISPVLCLIFISLLAHYSYYEAITVSNVLTVFSLVAFIGTIVAFLIFQRNNKNYYGLEKEYQLAKWRTSLWKISLIGWLVALNIQLSFILLGYFANNDEVAQFKVAAQITSLIPFGLIAINSIQMPALNKAYNNNQHEELQRLANRSCIFSTFFGMPIILIVLFFGESLLTILFGSEYHKASNILLILAVGQIINVSAGSTGLLMLVSRKEHMIVINLGFTLLLNVGFCIILIPSLGAIGAAIASTISLALKNVFLIYYLYRNIGIVSLPIIWRKN